MRVALLMKDIFPNVSTGLAVIFFGLTVLACQGRSERVLILGSQQDPEMIEFFASEDFEVTTSSNLSLLQEDSIRLFGAVILDHMSLSQLDHTSMNALDRYLEAGGTCIGINLEGGTKDSYRSTHLARELDAVGPDSIYSGEKRSVVPDGSTRSLVCDRHPDYVS